MADDDEEKNRKNSFVLGETTSLMVCLHALPYERAHCQSPQAYHQSRWDFTQNKSKNHRAGALKNQVRLFPKGFAGMVIVRSLFFSEAVFLPLLISQHEMLRLVLRVNGVNLFTDRHHQWQAGILKRLNQ